MNEKVNSENEKYNSYLKPGYYLDSNLAVIIGSLSGLDLPNWNKCIQIEIYNFLHHNLCQLIIVLVFVFL